MTSDYTQNNDTELIFHWLYFSISHSHHWILLQRYFPFAVNLVKVVLKLSRKWNFCETSDYMTFRNDSTTRTKLSLLKLVYEHKCFPFTRQATHLELILFVYYASEQTKRRYSIKPLTGRLRKRTSWIFFCFIVVKFKTNSSISIQQWVSFLERFFRLELTDLCRFSASSKITISIQEARCFLTKQGTLF